MSAAEEPEASPGLPLPEDGNFADKRRDEESPRRKESSRDRRSASRDRRSKDRRRDRDRSDSPRSRRHRSYSRDHRSRRRSPSPRRRRYDDDYRRSSRRSPSPPRRRHRSRTPPEVRAQRQREREIEKMDRDMRTVFGYNLPLRAEEEDLFAFFVRAGPLNDIKIIRDRATSRSKGVAYVEYQRKEDVIAALALSGQAIMGQAVMVKMSEAEKNLAWEAAEAQKAQARELEARGGAGPATFLPGVPPLNLDMSDPTAAAAAVAAAAGFGAGTAPAAARLSIGNLHPAVTEADLRPIFEPFGLVDGVTVQRDASTGQGTGSAWVTYRQLADAARAAHNLNGFTLVDRALQVVIDANGLVPSGGAAPPSVVPGAAAAASGQINAINEQLDTSGADDGGGLRLTSAGRTALMSALAAGAGMEVPTIQLPGGQGTQKQPDASVPESVRLDQGLLGPASPIPTQCVLLKNMFDPGEETEINWAEDIATDVRDECAKFGEVWHIHVDPESKGFVYLKFGSVPAAQAGVKALHGRWFAGRQIAAVFQFAAVYNAHFKL